MERVGFSLALTREGILLTTTIHISGLNDAACFLTTPGFTHPIPAMQAGSLPTGWLGISRVGFEPCAAGSHPLGHDNEFHELSPNPLVSGFLGATMRGLGGWGRRNPARDACGKLVGAQRAAERLQAILRPMPLEVKGALLERHIPAKRRQAAIQQHICVMSPETFGQPERPGTSQTPSARVVGNGLEVFVTGQHRGRRLWPVLSQSCFFESFGICKSLNLREPIFGFYP
jgi:hypothetical protein